MGSWGPGIYQNDIAEDVRQIYQDQLRRGKSGEQVTQELIAEYSYVLNDVDDAPCFWFALSDIQWNFGRLEDFVKQKALYYINFIINEGVYGTQRHKELLALMNKLCSPQPSPKKITPYRLYYCQWKIGDVYAYPLKSAYAAERGLSNYCLLFHKIDEYVYDKGHIIPIVRIKITECSKIPTSVEEFNELEYVQTAVLPLNDVADKLKVRIKADSLGNLPIFMLKLINVSKKSIPDSLFYVGNFQKVKLPDNEYIPEEKIIIPGFLWKFFDRIIVDRYFLYKK